MATAGKDSRGNATINGVSRFIRLIYDAQNSSAQYPNTIFDQRQFSRFKFNVIYNYFLGTFNNAILLANKALPLGMFTVGVGTVAGLTWREDPETTSLQMINSAAFRAQWKDTPGALVTSVADEPRDQDLDFVEEWNDIYKAEMPNIATFNVLLQEGFNQAQLWAGRRTGEWFAVDPYPIGAGPETGPPVSDDFGYANFSVAEGCANVKKYATLNGKIPIAVLQIFKFGSSSRPIKTEEIWQHTIMAVVEGMKGIGHWAFGQSGAGALHAQSPSEVTRIENALIEITALLENLEPLLLDPPKPQLLIANSTQHSTGSPIEWRKAALTSYLTPWPGQAVWLFSHNQTYLAELAALNAGDTSKSYMLDQATTVRTRVFEDAEGTGYVFAYNHQPDEIAVTFQWYKALTSVIDLASGKIITPSNNEWSDTIGGASSLLQGDEYPARIYKLITGPTAPPTSPLVATIDSPITGGNAQGTILVLTSHTGAPVGPVTHVIKVGTQVLSSVVATLGAATHSIDTTTLDNGARTFDLEVMDSALRVATASITLDIQNFVPLSVQIVSPPAGATLTGVEIVRVDSLGGAVGVKSYMLFVDGALQFVTESLTGTVFFTLDTRTIQNGVRVLQARVIDSEMEEVNVAVTVVVQNQAEPGDTGVPDPGPTPTTPPFIGPCEERRFKISGTFSLKIEGE